MEYVSFIFLLRLGLSAVTVGNFTDTVVRDNIIYGGFASDIQDSSIENKGQNKEDAIIKSVTERSKSSSSHAKRTPLASGSVLRSDLELGLVTDTSRTSASLARSLAINSPAPSGMPWPSPLPVISPCRTIRCSGTQALSDQEVPTARITIPLQHLSLSWSTTTTPRV